ncbi:hypothetical protein SUGI_1099110 [Cryptomeria japonica]|nr:hypothetical protein SUGI_1099110 [Cryptomeria japonica]
MLDARGHAHQHHAAEGFQFLTLPDGFGEEHEGRFHSDVLEKHLAASLSEYVPPMTCIISESFVHCTHQVAVNLRVSRVVFWTYCAAAYITQFKAELLLSRGYIPNVITCLPGNLPPLLPTDLTSFYRIDNLVKSLDYQSKLQNESKGDYVLVNTMGDLEGKEAVAALSINGYPAVADITQGEPAVLPHGFFERIGDTGLIVGWAPQVKVLYHPSVGAFLTHNGWNSVMESISFGIPMLGWPYFADHFFNCRFAKDVWKIGMDFEGVDVDEHRLVSTEEVKKGVRSIMECKEARQRVLKLKEVTVKAVSQGRSSFLNLDKFIEDITQIAKSFPR